MRPAAGRGRCGVLPSYLALLAYLAACTSASGYLDTARRHLAERSTERDISEITPIWSLPSTVLPCDISEISEISPLTVNGLHISPGTPQAVPARDAWRWRAEECATCAATPTGRYPDGSPRYGCYDPATHRPIFPAGAAS